MNIFIYGNQSFTKDIQKILKNSKKIQALDDIQISQISDVNTLKDHIITNANDVYLIDDEKIIKKSRFKLLKSKDGIEEEFLSEFKLDDLAIETLEELPDYIVKKYEKLNENKEEDLNTQDLHLDKDLSGLLENENKKEDNNAFQEPKNDLNDELAEEEHKVEPKILHTEDFSENFGLNNISFDYDDDSTINENVKKDEDLLNDILKSNMVDDEEYEFVGETFEDINFLDEIFPDKKIDTPSAVELEKKSQEREKFEKDFIDNGEDLLAAMKDIEFENLDTNEDILDDEDLKKSINLENFDESYNFDSINSECLEEISQDNIQNSKTLQESKTDEIIQKIEEDQNEVEKEFDFSNSLDDINNTNSQDIQTNIETSSKNQGDLMSDEFLELDSLNEKDLMDALSELPMPVSNTSSNDMFKIKEENSIELNSSNVQEIANLITKLLNNKTLEITIKIKD